MMMILLNILILWIILLAYLSHSLIAIGKKVMQFSSNNFKSKISLYPSISELLKEI